MSQAALAPRYGLPRFIKDWPALWQELYEERAAIKEFVGNLPRYFAEQDAEREIRQIYWQENGHKV